MQLSCIFAYLLTCIFIKCLDENKQINTGGVI